MKVWQDGRVFRITDGKEAVYVSVYPHDNEVSLQITNEQTPRGGFHVWEEVKCLGNFEPLTKKVTA